MDRKTQLCTAPEITLEDPCLRVARWVWRIGEKTIFLCNHHHEPFETGTAVAAQDYDLRALS